MSLSVREREVLEVVVRCQAMGMHVLEQHFEDRMPADELRVVVKSLETKGAVVVMPGSRNDTVAISPSEERRRRG
jgi:hypothetical protein